MPSCPNCGAEHGPQANFCQVCGTELAPDAPAGQTAPSGRQPSDEETVAAHRQEVQQPAGGRGNGRQTQPGGSRGPQSGSDGGITRRHLLAGGGALAVAGAAGWYVFLRDSRGPAETVETLYAAINEGNYDQAMALIHDEGPVNETTSRSSLADSSAQAQAQVTGTEVIDQSDGRASVRVTITTDQLSHERTLVFELRSDNGQWKVWDTRLERDEQVAQTAPQVQLSFDHESSTDGDVVRITHSGGDELDGRSTTVTITGAPSGGVDGEYDWTALGGPASTTAGNEVTIDRSTLSDAGATIDGDLDLSGATVRVLWSPSSDQSAVLGEFEVPA